MTDHIPLYPDEATIAALVLGPKRAKEWPAKARYLEDKHGLPCVDELMGGRYWPAVEAYFRTRHGAAGLDGSVPAMPNSRVRIVPFKPDGEFNFEQ